MATDSPVNCCFRWPVCFVHASMPQDFPVLETTLVLTPQPGLAPMRRDLDPEHLDSDGEQSGP